MLMIPIANTYTPLNIMMFDAQCTACKAVTQTPLHYEGISIKCSTCGNKFVAVDPKDRLFKFHCSSCGGKIQAKEKLRGTLAPCPHCEKVVPVGEYNMETKPLPDPVPAAKEVESSTDGSAEEVQANKPATSKLGRKIGKIFGRD